MKCLISSVTSVCEVKTASILMMKAPNLEGREGWSICCCSKAGFNMFLIGMKLLNVSGRSSLEAPRQCLKLTEEINTAYFLSVLYQIHQTHNSKATRRNLCHYIPQSSKSNRSEIVLSRKFTDLHTKAHFLDKHKIGIREGEAQFKALCSSITESETSMGIAEDMVHRVFFDFCFSWTPL